MKEILCVDRNCDVCGGGRLDEIIAYTTKARTRSETFLWKVRNVICRNCGFAFVSPAPSGQSLAKYYSDCFPLWGGETLEFCLEKRLSLLRRNIQPGLRPDFVELGCNATKAFQSALRDIVGTYRSVELNNACGSDVRSLQVFSPNSVDILGAYFVFEHLSNPGEFLSFSARCLKEKGILVIEVPNLYIYPINPAGIILYEHTNHFSPRSLAILAEAQGLELVEISYQDCSRPYGFAAVFSKSGRLRDTIPLRDDWEYQIAKTCMTEGARFIQTYHEQLAEVRKEIRKAGKKELSIVLWAANKYCLDLLNGFELPTKVVIVDSDAGKKDYLAPLRVYQPGEVTNFIRGASLFVINSSLHSDEILNWIRNNVGRKLMKEEFVIIEPGFPFYKTSHSEAPTL